MRGNTLAPLIIQKKKGSSENSVISPLFATVLFLGGKQKQGHHDFYNALLLNDLNFNCKPVVVRHDS